MEFNELQISPPKYWQQFEDLCLDIFRRVWSDPTAQKNGRQGQPQHGTDIWGRAISDESSLRGVQCKGKDAGYGGSITWRELRSEIEKAKSFSPALSHWVLATTATKDAAIEQIAREITQAHREVGLFDVQVLGWQDLQSLLADYPDAIEKHYPDQAPKIRLQLERISRALEKPTADLAADIRVAADAARRDLDQFQRAVGGAKSLLLDFQKEAEGKHQSISHSDVVIALRSGQSMLLEAEPGAGKSTALLQLAEALMQSNDCVPVVVPLPELAFAQREVIDEVANRSNFGVLEKNALFRVATAGRLIVLCDGGNELTGEQRTRVHLGLAKFRREFPACGLLLATRARSPSLIQETSRLFLSPATRAQQLHILTEALGPAAESLLTKARRVPGLRDLLGTPLYVVVLADIGTTGTLPATKEEAIRRFIEHQERRTEHQLALNEELQSCHGYYLRAVGKVLNTTGSSAITQSDLRTEIATVSAQLVAKGQIGQRDSQSIIDLLVSHHVLLERVGAAGERFYSFQHQQFQEWFASFYVEDCIISAAQKASPDNLKILTAILDQVDWTEAILFAVERLSRLSIDGARSVSEAILRAVGVDPMLAAVMIRRASAETWNLIAASVARFAAEWYKTDESDRAFRFMAGTGRPEFAELVWETIKNKGLYDRSANFDSGWFAPSVLGPNAGAHYSQLTADRRRALLWDIALFGGQEGIDFAVEMGHSESSAEVVQSVLETLEFTSADTEFSALLRTASPEVWARLGYRHPLSETKGDLRLRLLEEKKKLAAASPSIDRLNLLLELAELGEYDNPEEIVGVALEVKFKQNDYHAEHATFTRLAALYPDQLSRVVIERLVRGESLSSITTSFVRVARSDQQQSLRNIALGPMTSDRRAKETAGRALNVESVQSLIGDLFATLDELQSKSPRDAEPFRQRYRAITDALNVAHREVLVSSLVAVDAKRPRHIAALAELLFRWRSDERNESLANNEAVCAQLSNAIDRWVERIIDHPETTREELADLATAIKCVAQPGLLSSLKRLFHAELEAWHGERSELDGFRQKGRPASRANMKYTLIYRAAFEALDGEPVRDFLLSQIGDPDFEVEAAFALLRYGRNDQMPSAAESIGWPKYKLVSPARARRPQRRVPTSPIAAAILDRVDELLKSESKEDLQRAIHLGCAAAQMDYGDRFATIGAAIAAPGSVSARLGLLQILVFTGEPISAATVRQGFNEVLTRITEQRWQTQTSWWEIERWLELMAFSDAPESIIDCVAALPPDFKRAHNFHRVVFALGHADIQHSLKTLIALADHVPALATTRNYLDAIATTGSLEATNYLISLAFDQQHVAADRAEWFSSADTFAEMLRKHPSAKRDFLDRIAKSQAAASSQFLMRVLPAIADQQDVLTLLQGWDFPHDEPIFHGLERTLQELAVVDRRVEGTSTYEREPSDLSKLRGGLFRIYLETGLRAVHAAKLLSIIDRQRDRYGRPAAERRHPDIQSGAPWPAAAGTLLQPSTQNS